MFGYVIHDFATPTSLCRRRNISVSCSSSVEWENIAQYATPNVPGWTGEYDVEQTS